MFDDNLWIALGFLFEFFLRSLLVMVILTRHRVQPSSTLAWVVLILAVPFFGLFAYLLVGQVRLGKKRRDLHKEISKKVESPNIQSRLGIQEERIWDDLPLEHRQIARLGEAVSHNLPLPANAIELIGKPDDFRNRLIQDIDDATDYCHLEFYIYLADRTGGEVGEALVRAVKRGVTCRLLVDSVGSRGFLRSDLRRNLIAGGVSVTEALPASLVRVIFSRIDLRNHRKIAIIDGCIGYTGSQNIADPEFAPKKKFAPWIDTMVRIKGPVLRDMQDLANEDWLLENPDHHASLPRPHPDPIEDGMTAQIIGTGPNSYNQALRQLMHTAFNTAKEELILTTPYFVPDETTVTALCTAARRGVATHLVVPARNDSPFVAAASRSYYAALLDSGVQIHHFEPGLLHAKTMTVDRDLAIVSTANLDRRSFELNFEVSLIVYDSDFASHLRLLQKSYIDQSFPIDQARWERRHWIHRLWHNAVGLLSPLL